MRLTFAAAGTPAIPLHLVTEDACEAWIDDQAPQVAAWVRAAGFTGALGRTITVPGADGGIAMAVAGYGTPAARARGRFHLAGIAAALPEATYRVEGLPRPAAGLPSPLDAAGVHEGKRVLGKGRGGRGGHSVRKDVTSNLQVSVRGVVVTENQLAGHVLLIAGQRREAVRVFSHCTDSECRRGANDNSARFCKTTSCKFRALQST